MKHGSLISPDEASFSFGPSSFAQGSFAPKADGGADLVTVPDADLLFNGDFTRAGDDLTITGTDGQSFLVEDYFRHDKRPILLSPEGASLTGDVVDALAGPLAPGQYAQAGNAQGAGQAIGRVEKVEGSATVIRNGVAITLNAGDVVMKGDVVQTGTGGQVAILFADGSTFSLSSNARMVLNDFVYQEGGANNSALISLVQGTIGFVAGQVAKTGDMRVDTPVATMGIRGTAVLVEISANNGETSFSVLVEPDGTTGSFNLYNKSTGTLLGTVNSSTIGWVVTPAGPLQVLAQQMQKTPGEVQQELNFFQHIFNIFQQGQQNPFDPDQHTSNPQGTQTAGTQFLIFDGGLPQTGDSGNNNGIVIVTVGGGEGGNGNNHGGLLDVPEFVNFPPIAVPDGSGNPASGGSGHTNSVIEAGVQQPDNQETPGTTTASGNVIDNDTDPNPGDILTLTSIRSLSDELHGGLSINSLGAYTYTLDNDKAAYLAEGETAVDLFEYTITDAFGATATSTLRIVIHGTNDAPVIVDQPVALNFTEPEGQTFALVDYTEGSEYNETFDPAYHESGSLAFEDVDISDNNHIVSFELDIDGTTAGGPTPEQLKGFFSTSIAQQTGAEGTSGSIGWSFTPPDDAFEYLAEGEHITLTYTVTLTDDEGATDTQTVTVTVNGTNDAPVITTEAVQEAELTEGSILSDTGAISFADVDYSDALIVEDNAADSASIVWSGGDLSEDQKAALRNGFSLGQPVLNQNTPGNDGTVQWTYAVSEQALDFLDEEETVTLTVAVTVTDQEGVSDSRDVTITINGSNDAPTFTSTDLSAVAPGPLTIGQAFSFTIPETVFHDIDGESLTYAPTYIQDGFPQPLPEWLEFHPDTRTFSGVAPAEAGAFEIALNVSDGTVFAADENNNFPTLALVVQNSGIPNDVPFIATEAIQTEDVGDPNSDVTKVLGLSVLDANDTGHEDAFLVTATAAEGTLNLADETNDEDPALDTVSFRGSLADINQVLGEGLVYTPSSNPEAPDMITLTVKDPHGGTDTVNFVFNATGEGDENGNASPLIGTEERDLLFASGVNDNMTGNGGNDAFVFSFAEEGFGFDSIADFHAGNPQEPGAEMDKIIFADSPYASFEQLQLSEDMQQEGDVVTITHDNGQITLTLADGQPLTAANFIFQQQPGELLV